MEEKIDRVTCVEWDDRLVTKGQAAKFFGVHERTINNWMRSGLRAFKRPNGTVRFWMRDLVAFAEQYMTSADKVT